MTMNKTKLNIRNAMNTQNVKTAMFSDQFLLVC